jgi:predicted PurR-regulated permease PerM
LALEQAGVPAEARMGWFAVLFWPSLVYSIVQLVESYILTPVIAGKATDLSPLAIFVAVLAGGALAGIYGMLLSIPVAACLKILAVEVLLPRIRAWTRGEVSDPLPVGRDG